MAEKTEQERERGLVSYQSRDGQEIRLTFDTVRRFLVSGKAELVTEQEMLLYMGMCKARGLNPFKKDVYLVKYTQDDPAASIVSIDYFRARSRAQDDCQGWKTGVIVKGVDGNLEYREGSIVLDEEQLIGGWFRAKPKGWSDEYMWTVSLKPFVKTTRDGKPTRFWQLDNQPYMIAKVAESQGLRRLWPDEFQGLFVEEEIIDVAPAAPYALPEATSPAPQAMKQQKPASDLDRARKKPEAPAKAPEPEAAKPASNGEVMREPTYQERVDAALKWINEQTDANSFPAPGELSPYIRGLKVADQEQICRVYNERRKQLTGS